MLIGDQRRTCTNEGRWNLPEFGYTECLREYHLIYLHLFCYLLSMVDKATRSGVVVAVQRRKLIGLSYPEERRANNEYLIILLNRPDALFLGYGCTK